MQHNLIRIHRQPELAEEQAGLTSHRPIRAEAGAPQSPARTNPLSQNAYIGVFFYVYFVFYDVKFRVDVGIRMDV